MSIRQERLAKGLCPDCGAEAAPYRLCDRCRFKGLLGRILRKGATHGSLTAEKRGRTYFYGLGDPSLDFEYREAQPGDKRLRPRVGGIPVDVEHELIEILRRNGKPMQIDKIYEAWGRLRLRRGRESAASDLANIIVGRQKQEAKLARRAERHRKMLAAQEARN